jgi:hypothetical protein
MFLNQSNNVPIALMYFKLSGIRILLLFEKQSCHDGLYIYVCLREYEHTDRCKDITTRRIIMVVVIIILIE